MSAKVMHRAAYMRGKPQGRTVSYVASTEAPVDTGYGREVLRMSGCDLTNYSRNPVVLDAHRRESISDVIGQAAARVEGVELIADVTYLDDADGQRALSKVLAGALRAVSIGYAVDESSVTRVRAGETVGGVEGPALIVGRWSLLEISNVPIPADANALRREIYTRALAHQSEEGDMARSKREDDETPPEDGSSAEGQPLPDEEREGDDPDQSEEQTDGEKARELMAEAEGLGISREDMAEALDRDRESVDEIADGEGDEAPEDLLEQLAEMIDEKRKRMAEEEAEEERKREEEAEEAPEGERAKRKRTLASRKRSFVDAAPLALRDLAEDTFLANPKRSQSAIWAEAVELAPAWAKADVLQLIRDKPLGSLEHYRAGLLALKAKRMKPTKTLRTTNSTTTTQRETPHDFSRLFGG